MITTLIADVLLRLSSRGVVAVPTMRVRWFFRRRWDLSHYLLYHPLVRSMNSSPVMSPIMYSCRSKSANTSGL